MGVGQQKFQSPAFWLGNSRNFEEQCRPVRRGGSGGSDEPPRTAREFRFFVEDRELLGITAREILRVRTNVRRALTSYRDDMPKPELFSAELRRWRKRYIVMPADERPSSPAQAIKECDTDMFPNISVLLKIACTLPVTSCECERSASALHHLLNNYMRATMGKDRLLFCMYTMTLILT